MSQERKRDLKKPDPTCKHNYHLLDTSMLLTCKRCGGKLMMGEADYTNHLVSAMQKSARGSKVTRGPDSTERKRRPDYYE